jgi:hypothetical protein
MRIIPEFSPIGRVRRSLLELFVLSIATLPSITVLASDGAKESGLSKHPAAADFRKQLAEADADKDGLVARHELIAAIASTSSGLDPAKIEGITGRMLEKLDTDKDGQLSMKEVEAGAVETAIQVNIRTNVDRAQQIMQGIEQFKKSNEGRLPVTLNQLVEANLLRAEANLCLLADGSEKPWVFDPNVASSDPKAAILYSPGRVDLKDQYMIGLPDGQVLGLPSKNVDLEKIGKLKVYTPEQ